MKVTVRLHEGCIDGISVLDDDKNVLFRVEMNAKHMIYTMLCITPHGMKVYNILRTELGRQHRIVDYVNCIRENLQHNYQINFVGIVWGSPQRSNYGGKIWLSFGKKLIISNDGDYGRDVITALEREKLPDCSANDLKRFAQSYFRLVSE